MAENDIPPRYINFHEANYKAEATRKDHLLAVALPILQENSRNYAPLILQFTLLCSKEIKQLKCFQSKGFVLRPISNTTQPIQTYISFLKLQYI